MQIDIDPATVGNRIPTEVPLVGDAVATLQALVPLLRRKADRSFLEEAQAAMADWREKMAALEDPDRDPIQPQYLMRVIDRHAARRRHPRVGFGDDRHLVGSPLRHPRRP